jgi:hypothetical protein
MVKVLENAKCYNADFLVQDLNGDVYAVFESDWNGEYYDISNNLAVRDKEVVYYSVVKGQSNPTGSKCLFPAYEKDEDDEHKSVGCEIK